ncbi:MAG: hypothetical protein JSS02_33585 [Planctomycetes bacterium]|nr:hypothetical protein [Planctomycetota bacterium]
MNDLNLLRQLAELPPQADNAPVESDRCRNLCCKGMYLNYGLGQNERVAGDGNFWCGKTQRIFGPDDQLVGDGLCRHTSRSCYEGT